MTWFEWVFWAWVFLVVIYLGAVVLFGWKVFHDDPRTRAENRGKR